VKVGGSGSKSSGESATPMRSLMPKIGLIFAGAIVCYGVVEFIPHVVDQYERLSTSSRILGRVYLSGVVIVTTLVATCGGYGLFRLINKSRSFHSDKKLANTHVENLTTKQKQQIISSNLDSVKDLILEHESAGNSVPELRKKSIEIQTFLESGQLRIVAFGTISSGKSALLNTLAGKDFFASDVAGGTTVRCASVPLPSADKVLLVDTPGLGEDRRIDHEKIAREQAMNADLILFVLDSDMRSFEEAVLAVLVEAKKPMIVCLNKSDWYNDDDVIKLVDHIAEYVRPHGIRKEDVVPVRTKAASRTRIRVLPCGTEVEETVTVDPNIEPLLNRLSVALKDRQGLLLNNLVEQARVLIAEVRQRTRAHLDNKAWEVVESYMWQAGAAAALSPLPILDIITGIGFTSKMVFDLAAVYRQPIDLNAARALLGELGSNSVGILGANLASIPVGALAASLIKVVPGVGTLAGGAMQGFIQALMVRWIGSTFIEYFRKEMKTVGGLAEVARQKWREVTQPSSITELAQRARTRSSKVIEEVS
jgi:uncharacterized protein